LLKGVLALLSVVAAPLRFHKYEGLGNDFLVVDATDERAVSPEQAVALCDRHRGVGGDGVLLVLPPRARAADAVARMRVINSDGSTPEMCGNGVRCVALHLVRGGKAAAGTVAVDTDAGVRACTVDSLTSGASATAGPTGAQVTVDMGVVRVLGDRALRDLLDPATPAGAPADLACTLADAGNPHAVLFGRFTRADVERLGPRLASHPSFPNGTNVEFAHAASADATGAGIGGVDSLDLLVWERGAGLTLACGTGACATVAVACARGLAVRGRAVTVRLPGGPLEVTVEPSGRATMRGPARYVFAGSMP
jgi:diaminopimelate epimerase